MIMPPSNCSQQTIGVNSVFLWPIAVLGGDAEGSQLALAQG
jgi:hypothetical protein